MKSVGEVKAIWRTVEETMQKTLRMVDESRSELMLNDLIWSSATVACRQPRSQLARNCAAIAESNLEHCKAYEQGRLSKMCADATH